MSDNADKLFFYMRCPQCVKVYEITFDTTKRHPPEGVGVVCCPNCKRHPVMNLITPYVVDYLREIKLNPVTPKIKVTKIAEVSNEK